MEKTKEYLHTMPSLEVINTEGFELAWCGQASNNGQRSVWHHEYLSGFYTSNKLHKATQRSKEALEKSENRFLCTCKAQSIEMRTCTQQKLQQRPQATHQKNIRQGQIVVSSQLTTNSLYETYGWSETHSDLTCPYTRKTSASKTVLTSPASPSAAAMAHLMSSNSIWHIRNKLFDNIIPYQTCMWQTLFSYSSAINLEALFLF